MSEKTYNLTKDEVRFDSDGNVVVSNKDFIKMVKDVLDKEKMGTKGDQNQGCGGNINFDCPH